MRVTICSNDFESNKRSTMEIWYMYIRTDTNIHTKLRGNISIDVSKFRFHVSQNYCKCSFMLFKFSWLKVVCVFDWLQKSNFYNLSQPWKFATEHQVISFFLFKINLKKTFCKRFIMSTKLFSSFQIRMRVSSHLADRYFHIFNFLRHLQLQNVIKHDQVKSNNAKSSIYMHPISDLWWH